MKTRPIQFTTAGLRAVHATGIAVLTARERRRGAGAGDARRGLGGRAIVQLRPGWEGPLRRAVAEISRTLAEVDFVRKPKRRRR